MHTQSQMKFNQQPQSSRQYTIAAATENTINSSPVSSQLLHSQPPSVQISELTVTEKQDENVIEQKPESSIEESKVCEAQTEPEPVKEPEVI